MRDRDFVWASAIVLAGIGLNLIVAGLIRLIF